MIETTPTIIYKRNDRIDGKDPEACAVAFEAPTLQELGSTLTQWMTMHPHYHPYSFSHAHETRWDYAPASLAGPRPVSVYTGILLVRPTSPQIERESSKEPSLYEPLPV